MRYLSFLIIAILFHNFIFGQKIVKMKREGGISVVDCKVNNLNLSFIFDTGASDVSISLTEALFMLKHNYLKESDIIGKASFSDATGKISEGYVVILRKIEFAGFTLYNIKATIVNNLKAPLLLGQSVLSELGSIELNLKDNYIKILSPKLKHDYSNFQDNSNYSASQIKGYSFVIVIKEYNDKSEAVIAFNKLISYGHKLLLYTVDGSIYKIAIPFSVSTAYSAQKQDSIKVFFGGNPYIEQKL